MLVVGMETVGGVAVGGIRTRRVTDMSSTAMSPKLSKSLSQHLLAEMRISTVKASTWVTLCTHWSPTGEKILSKAQHTSITGSQFALEISYNFAIDCQIWYPVYYQLLTTG